MAKNLTFNNRKICTVQDPQHLIAATSASYFNLDVQTVAIEVKNAEPCSIQIEGCMDDFDEENNISMQDDDCVWYPLAVINVSDYGVQDAIEDNGIFYVTLGGMRRFRFNVEDIAAISGATITMKRVD